MATILDLFRNSDKDINHGSPDRTPISEGLGIDGSKNIDSSGEYYTNEYKYGTNYSTDVDKQMGKDKTPMSDGKGMDGSKNIDAKGPYFTNPYIYGVNYSTDVDKQKGKDKTPMSAGSGEDGSKNIDRAGQYYNKLAYRYGTYYPDAIDKQIKNEDAFQFQLGRKKIDLGGVRNGAVKAAKILPKKAFTRVKNVLDQELSGLRVKHLVSVIDIYGTQLIRITKQRTNLVDDMKVAAGGRKRGGLVGAISQPLNKIKEKISNFLGLPEVPIPTFVVDEGTKSLGSGDKLFTENRGAEQDTMVYLSKIKKDARGSIIGRFLKQNSSGTPKQMVKGAVSSVGKGVKKAVRGALFGKDTVMATNEPKRNSAQSIIYGSGKSVGDLRYTITMEDSTQFESVNSPLLELKDREDKADQDSIDRVKKLTKNLPKASDIKSKPLTYFNPESKPKPLFGLGSSFEGKVPKFNPATNQQVYGKKEEEGEYSYTQTMESNIQYDSTTSPILQKKTDTDQATRDSVNRVKKLAQTAPKPSEFKTKPLTYVDPNTKPKPNFGLGTTFEAKDPKLSLATNQQIYGKKEEEGEYSYTQTMESFIKPDSIEPGIIENITKNGKYPYNFTSNRKNDRKKGYLESSTKITAEFDRPGAEYRKFPGIDSGYRLKFNKQLFQIGNEESTRNLYIDNVIIQIGSVRFHNAAITGLSETFSPSWSSYRMVGSPFNAYTYDSIDRSVSFNIKLYALNPKQHKENWDNIQKINNLVYPLSYVGSAGAVTPPITNITLGDMYINKSGFIESLSYNVDDEGAWELGRADEEVYAYKRLFENEHLKDGEYIQLGSQLNDVPNRWDKVNELLQVKNYKAPRLIEMQITFKFIEYRSSGEYSFKANENVNPVRLESLSERDAEIAAARRFPDLNTSFGSRIPNPNVPSVPTFRNVPSNLTTPNLTRPRF